jgi:hypothetical protein
MEMQTSPFSAERCKGEEDKVRSELVGLFYFL